MTFYEGLGKERLHLYSLPPTLPLRGCSCGRKMGFPARVLMITGKCSLPLDTGWSTELQVWTRCLLSHVLLPSVTGLWKKTREDSVSLVLGSISTLDWGSSRSSATQMTNAAVMGGCDSVLKTTSREGEVPQIKHTHVLFLSPMESDHILAIDWVFLYFIIKVIFLTQSLSM